MATREQALRAYTNRAARVGMRIQWFDQQVQRGIRITMSGRLDMTAQLLRDKIVANIALPIDKNSAGTVVQRSVRGEFPRAETGLLMRTTFWDKRGEMRRIIGTPLDYGLWLEVALDRSFLRRTLNEERAVIERLLSRRIN